MNWYCKTTNGHGFGNLQGYLDTGDAKSTSNLCKHVRICWGVETVVAADETQNYGATFDLIKQC